MWLDLMICGDRCTYASEPGSQSRYKLSTCRRAMEMDEVDILRLGFVFRLGSVGRRGFFFARQAALEFAMLFGSVLAGRTVQLDSAPLRIAI